MDKNDPSSSDYSFQQKDFLFRETTLPAFPPLYYPSRPTEIQIPASTTAAHQGQWSQAPSGGSILCGQRTAASAARTLFLIIQLRRKVRAELTSPIL
jgi:hypothetical protein